MLGSKTTTFVPRPGTECAALAADPPAALAARTSATASIIDRTRNMGSPLPVDGERVGQCSAPPLSAAKRSS